MPESAKISVRPAASKSLPVRPPDLIYALNERPPLARLVLLGFEFVAVIAPYLIFAALIFKAAHVPSQTAASAISLAMIGIAIATVLQVQRWGPIGSGFVAPPVISAIYFSPNIRAAAYGLPAVCAMTMLAGLCETAFAWVLPHMRKVFPPVVAGLIVMAVGVDLGLIGIRSFAGVEPGHGSISIANLAGAGVTLIPMVVFGVWGKGLARLLCTLIGLAVGLAIAFPLGLFSHESVTTIASTPLVALPDPRVLSYRFEYNLIVPFAIASLASGLRTIGVITTCERINDAGWRRPDLDNVRAGVMADGVACAIGGLLAAPGLSAAPSLVGMEKVTGATSRYIAYAIACWFLVLACFPKFGAALLALPLPVIGAALLFNAGSMFVGGIQIVTSRPMTMRATFVIGLSFLLAISRQVYPEFYAALPAWTDQFTGSMLSLAVACGVLLNLIFLIGERRVQSVIIESMGKDTSTQLSELLRNKGKEWLVNPSDLKRAQEALEELLHLIENGGHADGKIRAEISYDDFDLTVTLRYPGTLPYIASTQKLPAGMVEEQIFAVGLSGFLSSVVPDRLDSSCDNGECTLVLYFET